MAPDRFPSFLTQPMPWKHTIMQRVVRRLNHCQLHSWPCIRRICGCPGGSGRQMWGFRQPTWTEHPLQEKSGTSIPMLLRRKGNKRTKMMPKVLLIISQTSRSQGVLCLQRYMCLCINSALQHTTYRKSCILLQKQHKQWDTESDAGLHSSNICGPVTQSKQKAPEDSQSDKKILK